jgi:hypothetical protein
MPQSKKVHRATFFGAASVLLTVLAACRPAAPLPAELFPRDADGGWTRTSFQELPVSDAPDPVPRTSVERFAVAAYKGPGKLEARVYQLSSAAVGVELAQRWRPSADTIFFYRGRYFVVVKWESADRTALEKFVRELERRLAPLQEDPKR